MVKVKLSLQGCGLALLVNGASVLAQSQVLFIDGGYPAMCADAALTLDTPGNQITITGSRLDISPLEICTRAIDTVPVLPKDLAASYNNRGVIKFHAKDYPAALHDFDQATRVDPELAAAYINQGYALMALQRFADSLLVLDKGIALNPPDLAKAHYNRGIAHEQSGHVREAYYDYQKAAELAPDWAEPKAELARFKVTRK